MLVDSGMSFIYISILFVITYKIKAWLIPFLFGILTWKWDNWERIYLY